MVVIKCNLMQFMSGIFKMTAIWKWKSAIILHIPHCEIKWYEPGLPFLESTTVRYVLMGNLFSESW